MEQQEEEKGRQSSPTQVSNSILSLPIDLTSEILLKLSAKSIAKSRFVSKLWSSITTDSHFIKSFATRSLLLKPSILLILKKTDKLFVLTFRQHHQNSKSYSYEPLDSYQIECPKSFRFSFTESVHGFLCFTKSATPTVWNPTVRQFLTLPKPEKSWKNITVFLGYDPIEGKHKVVCMPCDKFSDECRVLTLGSAKLSWRKIKTNYNQLPFAGNDAPCIDGVVYYKACIDHMNRRVIMSFDVKSFKFQPIRLPWEIPWDTRSQLLLPYEGRLSFVHEEHGENGYGIKLWVLEKTRKWSDKSFLVRFKHCYTGLKTKLSGVTDAGEFIYLPSTILKSFCVLYFHPERNSFRKVMFQGIPDDDYRISNRLGGRRFHAIQSFPNHIENLSSL